jgi:hypothetical protein
MATDRRRDTRRQQPAFHMSVPMTRLALLWLYLCASEESRQVVVVVHGGAVGLGGHEGELGHHELTQVAQVQQRLRLWNIADGQSTVTCNISDDFNFVMKEGGKIGRR